MQKLVRHDPKLVRWDAMNKAIDACHKVDEVVEIRNKAVALEAYAKVALNTEAERRAIEIRLRAERKCGQMLKASGDSGERRTKTDGKSKVSSGATPKATLKDLGISRDQSASWQKLGDIPQDEFDATMGATDRKPSTKGLVRGTKPLPENKTSSDALWLWGRLRDFKEDGLLAKSPKDVMSTMSSRMKDEVHTLAPQVAAWLKRIGEMK